MAGRVLRIAPKTQIAFTKLQGSQSQTITLARRLDVSQYKEATAIFRLHSGSFGAAMTVNLVCYIDAYTDDDPSALFFGGLSANGGSFLTSTNLQGMSAPGVIGVPLNQSTTLSGGFGPMIALSLLVTQPAAPVSADITFSLDLSLKE